MLAHARIITIKDEPHPHFRLQNLDPMATRYALPLLLLLGTTAYIAGGARDSFKATALFNVTANSTCGGDTPTIFVYRGGVFNCSNGDHTPRFVLDNDPNTWWQSGNGVDPVSITFSLRGFKVVISSTILIYY